MTDILPNLFTAGIVIAGFVWGVAYLYHGPRPEDRE